MNPILFPVAVVVVASGILFSSTGSCGDVSQAVADRHRRAYSDQWKDSDPDLVVYIPEADLTPQSDNQHFLVFPLKDGTFFAVWTMGSYEGAKDMRVVFSKSGDRGQTWSRPETIAGPSRVESKGEKDWVGRAVWGFPIYVPARNRIYVFYGRELVSPAKEMASNGRMR